MECPIYYTWDEDTKVLTRHDGTCTTATPLTSGTSELRETKENGGWFVAADPLTYDSRLTVYGNVHLILADGCKVTANEGITVECAKDSSENTLTIYEQSEDGDMGVLEAFSPGGNSAAIGGISESYDSIITIHGGMVNASINGFACNGARIGGGSYNSGTVRIFGGTVNASVTKPNCVGAAIGNGEGGSGGSVEIGDGMRVLAGASESEADAVPENLREYACSSKEWVRVEVCPHDIEITDVGEYSCGLCNLASSGSGTDSSPNEIRTEGDWSLLSSALANGLSTGGKRFKLLNDISVATMIGSKQMPFEGVFDGSGKTLTVELTASASGKGPFAFVRSASFEHLRVAGTITIPTDIDDTGGLVGTAEGNCTITDCVSDVDIEAKNKSSSGHAGFVGYMSENFAIRGSLFTGSISGPGTRYCAGFVGKGGGTADDCVYDGTIAGTVENNTFLRQRDYAGNCYYTNTNGIQRVKGKQALAVTAVEGVRIERPTPVTTYPVSRITAYASGLDYDGRYCVAGNDELILTSDLTPREGEFLRYFGDYPGSSGGTLSVPLAHGSGSTWLMADRDVTVRAELLPIGA